MERMGIVPICKEAAQLLHQHFRLFLPFFLAFYLPASFLSVFFNGFLVPQKIITSFIDTTGHGEVTDSVLPSLILSQIFVTPMFILSTPGVVGFTYVVDYIYSDLSDDDAITRRVFKLLPNAFFRVLLTKIWQSVVALLFFSLIPSPTLFYIYPVFGCFLYVFWVAGTFGLAVMYGLAPFVAVLEQDFLGRKVLKQSHRYATGRAGTILSVVALGALVDGLIYFLHARAMALSLVAAVVAASVISVVFSFLSAYVSLVSIVTYFVCKSDSDVAALSAAENPYRPIVSGSTQVR